MTKLEELIKVRQELDAQIAAAEEDAQRQREAEVVKKINSITAEQREAIMRLTEHDRTSCSDQQPINGYSYMDRRWRCRKCMLMEILNGEHGGRFDFDIDIGIREVG